MATALISFGADPNGLSGKNSPLALALISQQFEVAIALIEHGADCNGSIGQLSIKTYIETQAKKYPEKFQNVEKSMLQYSSGGNESNPDAPQGSEHQETESLGQAPNFPDGAG